MATNYKSRHQALLGLVKVPIFGQFLVGASCSADLSTTPGEGSEWGGGER